MRRLGIQSCATAHRGTHERRHLRPRPLSAKSRPPHVAFLRQLTQTLNELLATPSLDDGLCFSEQQCCT